MNKKIIDKVLWFLLGFLGMPMILYLFLFLLGDSDDAFLFVFWTYVVTTIAATLSFWNVNRPLAVGGLVSLGSLLALIIITIIANPILLNCC